MFVFLHFPSLIRFWALVMASAIGRKEAFEGVFFPLDIENGLMD